MCAESQLTSLAKHTSALHCKAFVILRRLRLSLSAFVCLSLFIDVQLNNAECPGPYNVLLTFVFPLSFFHVSIIKIKAPIYLSPNSVHWRYRLPFHRHVYIYLSSSSWSSSLHCTCKIKCKSSIWLSDKSCTTYTHHAWQMQRGKANNFRVWT